ncbi:hypothetical protein [Chryseobacterium sp. MMS23-Vi53]|uniref:hypothetical protein n=1 Tax=Chryseobacterium sp. MMS23-Vi53 TaxID=3386644 RepID=UPI0039EC2D61
MDLIEFNKKVKETFPPFNNKHLTGNILNITESYLTEFYRIVSEIDENIYGNIVKENILDKIKIQNENILKSIKYFLAGEIIEYYLSIYDTFFNSNLGLRNIYYKKLPKRIPFFRLRTNTPNKKFKSNEMFHIPFEEVRRTGNQRFSLSGHPALYLGSSTYICWEELSNPSLETCNFSVLSNEEEVTLFDLTPPSKIKRMEDILRYPLIISSSIKFTDNGFPFKPEYIISQAVYFSLLKFNKDLLLEKDVDVKKLDGIIYLSTHISNELLFSDLNLMCNYVFPVKNIEEKGYCEKLKKLFSVSESKSINDLLLKYPQLFIEEKTTYIEEYELSIFKTIEKYICGKTVFKSLIE